MDLALLGAGIAVLTGIGAAIGIGLAALGGCLGIARQPEKEGSIRTIAILGIVMAEACAIYGLLITFILLARA
jgi:F-type H+-transporting ATPase subunit c